MMYQISEGYLEGDIFESIDNDVTGTCEKMQWDFGDVLNPNFLVMEKVRLIDCLEKMDFKDCWKRLESMRSYVNPGNVPERAELRFYAGDHLLRDGSNICEGEEIRVVYSDLLKFGVDSIRITGPGNCENTVQTISGDPVVFSVREFLCGDGEPVDGGKYEMEADPGTLGEKVVYEFNYYEDSKKCRVREDVVLV
jgi:hypothetical protein